MTVAYYHRSWKRHAPSQYLVILLAVLFALLVPAESAAVVKYLPGYPGELPFYLETGYVGVGDDEVVQLFYYLVESQSKNSSTDPLLFWVNGGPGCSSLAGFFFESGPLNFEVAGYNGSMPSMHLNPFTWTKSVNVVYMDAPVGTGFSYATTSKGYYLDDDNFASQLFQFIKKWLDDHPGFAENELYVGGDSYSGTPIPIFVEGIVQGKWKGSSDLNLKGYVLGNPVTDTFIDDNSRIPYAHRLTLISDKIFAAANKSCNGNFVVVDPTNVDCITDIDTIDELVQQVLLVHVLEPNCKNALGLPIPTAPENPTISARRSLAWKKLGSSIRSRAKGPALWCRNYNHMLCMKWANHKEVRAALHVRDGTKSAWLYCNSSLAYTENVKSVIPYHKNLTRSDLRALIYSGDHDMSIPHMGTQKWIDFLNMTLLQKWRPWFVTNQTAGYTKNYTSNKFSLTFATIKGAGHFAAEYKVRECSAMVRRWMAYQEV
ncbi:hypothetical protein SAY86_032004 [Trapa natans]|uniref:Serine carboxypeptidase-like 18 n=1 Tax=Trapa natans TaxID=22666 RepID=A0AAN7LSB4_TRANT|nr:hypothetical protein SAY86_032004 [Trapa natans]